jgi:hypothetical protein
LLAKLKNIRTGQPKKPSIVLDRRGLPVQLSGTAQVGPAYATFEEAFQNKAHARCHIAEVVLFDKSHKLLANWWEVSESLGIKGVGRAGDTEQKALTRVNLREGQTLEIRGAYNPCPITKGCDIAMQNAAEESGAEIIYRTYGKAKRDKTGKVTTNSKGHAIHEGTEQVYPKHQVDDNV